MFCSWSTTCHRTSISCSYVFRALWVWAASCWVFICGSLVEELAQTDLLCRRCWYVWKQRLKESCVCPETGRCLCDLFGEMTAFGKSSRTLCVSPVSWKNCIRIHGKYTNTNTTTAEPLQTDAIKLTWLKASLNFTAVVFQLQTNIDSSWSILKWKSSLWARKLLKVMSHSSSDQTFTSSDSLSFPSPPLVPFLPLQPHGLYSGGLSSICFPTNLVSFPANWSTSMGWGSFNRKHRILRSSAVVMVISAWTSEQHGSLPGVWPFAWSFESFFVWQCLADGSQMCWF